MFPRGLFSGFVRRCKQVSGAVLIAALSSVAFAANDNPTTYQNWVIAMKGAERGPFSGIRWFCEDGTNWPARPYPCTNRGGGVQHGIWNDRARQLRNAGYTIANVLVAVEPEAFFARSDWRDQLAQILLERFLIDYDDGWIFHRARSYRGALQAEDEIKGAREILSGLFQRADRGNQDFLLIREAYRLLPQEYDAAGATKVRNLATKIAANNNGFAAIRTKIHNQPDLKDATRVRDFAHKLKSGVSADYEALAVAIEELHTGNADLSRALNAMIDRLHPDQLQAAVRQAKQTFEQEKAPEKRLKLAAGLMRQLRDAFPTFKYDATRMATLGLSLALEQEVFTSGNKLHENWAGETRESLVGFLGALNDSLYGSGLISRREWQGVSQSVRALSKPDVALASYRDELHYLNRVSQWANRWLRFHFEAAERKLVAIEPLADRFVPDRLRSSPLLVYSSVLDALQKDANDQSGIRYEIFGKAVGSGVRPLNPGLARGILTIPDDLSGTAAGNIVVVPETLADLPPVAGIITLGEGNALSHVQLLASNMGIPNVVIDQELMQRLGPYAGQHVILAVSPGGTVKLEMDGPQWNVVFGNEQIPDERLHANLEKLDLDRRALVPLADLRATDAGRIVGPKAANLGELKYYFPKAVVSGLVIPFGVFRELLEQPYGDSGLSVFQWMRGRYREIDSLPVAEQPAATKELLKRLREWILAADPGPKFRAALKQKMRSLFGEEGSYALFVRSDTNMEDLPGFTGAGLNLTVPNVRGFDNIVQAIKQVWASPFSERSYAWRQRRMDDPENVYPSVLLMPGVAVAKSGVLLTMDTENGKTGGLTIAVNHGVGGAVQGQAAEEVRVGSGGSIRVLADATDPVMRVLDAGGGLRERRVNASGKVLEDSEIRHLINFARELQVRFPQTDESGQLVAADVEFGFRNGELVLFQVRPFLQNQRVRKDQFLAALDRPVEGRVDMRAKPE